MMNNENSRKIDRIIEGISSSELELIGGIIRNVKDGSIVLWIGNEKDTLSRLSEGLKGVSSTARLLAIVPFDISFSSSILLSTFSFLVFTFRNSNNELSSIEIKIDTLALSKIQSGLELAEDAEAMNDSKHAIQQLINARTSLTEGIKYFTNVLQQSNKDSTNSKATMPMIYMIVTGKIGEIRTYLWTKEYVIGINHLANLQLFVLDLRMEILKSAIKEIKHNKGRWKRWVWWGYFLFLPFTALPLFIAGSAIYLVGKVLLSEEDVLEDTKNVRDEVILKRKKSVELEQKIADLLEKNIHDKDEFLPGHAVELEGIDFFLQGYMVEAEHMQAKSLIPSSNIISSIPKLEV